MPFIAHTHTLTHTSTLCCQYRKFLAKTKLNAKLARNQMQNNAIGVPFCSVFNKMLQCNSTQPFPVNFNNYCILGRKRIEKKDFNAQHKRIININNLYFEIVLSGAESWYSEYRRLTYNIPMVLTDDILDAHSHQVLHVSFSHNGKMFATCSKDGFVIVSIYLPFFKNTCTHFAIDFLNFFFIHMFSSLIYCPILIVTDDNQLSLLRCSVVYILVHGYLKNVYIDCDKFPCTHADGTIIQIRF